MCTELIWVPRKATTLQKRPGTTSPSGRARLSITLDRYGRLAPAALAR